MSAWRRAEPALRSASVSLFAVDVATGETVYAADQDRVLVPASLVKLFTTAAALDVLGPEHRLITSVLATGHLDASGVLTGDVRLVGAGDPHFSARFDDSVTTALDGLVDSLHARGVRTVHGSVIGDDTVWTDERLHPSWADADLGEWFGAEVSALTFNDNTVDLHFSGTGSVGSVAQYRLDPATSYVRVDNRVRVGPAGAASRIDMFRDRGSHTLRATGTVARDDSVTTSGTVPDPALYAATIFRDRLVARGIAVDGPARSARGPSSTAGSETLAVHLLSRPLADIVRVVNLRSQNLHAEILLRLTDADRRPASPAGGLARGRVVYERLGVPARAFRLVDGSGLSRENRTSARALATLLRSIQRTAPWREAYWASLPLAARDGVLQRMAGGPADGRLRLKTGRMSRVRGAAGLVETPRGRLIAFAGIVNGRPGSERAAERMLDTLAVHLTTAD